jgi:hypothetical protein
METLKNNQKIRIENEVVTDERTLNSKANIRDFYTHQVTPLLVKNKPGLSLRIRKFFIMKHSKRLMEFGLHRKGVHFMGDAIFHSESGCINCKLDLEKSD